MKALKVFITFLVIGLILSATFLMLRITVPYLSFRYDVNFLLTKQSVLHKDIWRWAFYVHITTSIFVLFFGMFQFIKTFRAKYLRLHRVLGKVYVLLILVFSAPSGLIMGYYANGGMWAKISFVLLSALWWWFTLQAYLGIRRKNLSSHSNYMVRSYALTLSAITLRTYVLVLPFFFILPAKEMYTLVAWLSWVPNLVIAEGLIGLHAFR